MIQHLLGLATAVLIYAFLLRSGARRRGTGYGEDMGCSAAMEIRAAA